MPLQQPIYLDYNATTPVDARVLETMLPYFTHKFGNAASNSHNFGWQAADAVKHARQQVATLINATEQEVYFTSGSTEGLNLALKGLAEAYSKKGNHLITCKTEHKAVLDVCHRLEKQGTEITYLSVDPFGGINLNELKAAIKATTIGICLMYANNETGVLHPVAEIGQIATDHNLVFICDSTQAIGKVPVDVIKDNIHMLVLSAHKFYGPKGVGAIYVRRKNPRVALIPQIDGGGHENGLRSGTLNVPGIVGLGAAAELATRLDGTGTYDLLNKLEKELLAIGGISINGDIHNRLPNTLNIQIEGIKSEKLITRVPQLAMATGSACTSALPQPSHVLMAMGLTEEQAYSSLRLSIGRFTTEEEIEQTALLLSEAIIKLRG
ncbi:MAG: aminotransferase class V-fold PLP-dependent enzyme [Sphingobacteriales bacterium JAD_PAG50586_3]|nr:MAG: aminotransferase class V-fold PLP-dependent enzyme [Sphingobacteriales bacterium JAD_PAG50586_3]